MKSSEHIFNYRRRLQLHLLSITCGIECGTIIIVCQYAKRNTTEEKTPSNNISDHH